MTRFALPNLLLVIGATLTVLVVAWWCVVFDELVRNRTMTFGDVVPCLVHESDICSLAQSLCKGDHFLDISRYFVQAFWVSGAFMVAALAMRVADLGGNGRHA